MKFRRFLAGITPPFLASAYRRIRWGDYWRGIYASFSEIPRKGDGFNAAAYVQPTITDTEAIRKLAGSWRTIPGHVVEEDAYLPLVASLIAERKRATVRVLDFGGGAGISFVHLVSAMAARASVDYHVVELDWACTAGRDMFASDARIHFHNTLPDDLPDLDIVLLKGVLMVIEDYKELLRRLCGYGARYVFFVNVLVGDFPTFASVQRNLPEPVPHWFFNLDEIVGILAGHGYSLIFRGALSEVYRQDGFPKSHRVEHGRASVLLFALQK